MVKHIGENDFKNEVLEQKDKLILVDFYADWCGPCRLTGPVIDELANELKEVKFIKINVDENPQLAGQYSVFSIPTFLFFKNGQVVDQLVGAAGKEKFLEIINKNLR
jgi:thioredoxin 1